MTAAGNAPEAADLVLTAGGVRGIALAGAVTELAAAGYSFPRIAGSSAGAIAGALTAALVAAGEPTTRLADLALTLDYRKFRDPGSLGRFFGWPGDGLELVLHDGVFRGDYLERWLTGVLADLGVRTFGDLRLPADPAGDLPDAHRYRLVVTASDVSRRRLALLPWDFSVHYGLDPDEQQVGRAVRASAAIPFFFRPVRLPPRPGAGGAATLVDGGLLAGFPLSVFDRTDGRPPRWPTFGVALVATAGSGQPPPAHDVGGPLSLLAGSIETMINAQDSLCVNAECDRVRTMADVVDGVSALDFGIGDAAKRRLLASGTAAARAFLAGWDWPRYLAACRGGAP